MLIISTLTYILLTVWTKDSFSSTCNHFDEYKNKKFLFGIINCHSNRLPQIIGTQEAYIGVCCSCFFYIITEHYLHNNMECTPNRVESFYGRKYSRTATGGTFRRPISPAVLQDQYSRY